MISNNPLAATPEGRILVLETNFINLKDTIDRNALDARTLIDGVARSGKDDYLRLENEVRQSLQEIKQISKDNAVKFENYAVDMQSKMGDISRDLSKMDGTRETTQAHAKKIEALETAQNTSEGRTANNRIWIGVLAAASATCGGGLLLMFFKFVLHGG